MRWSLLIAFVLLAVLSSTAFAGRIFGDLSFGGKPVPEGLLVTLQRVIKTEDKDKDKGKDKDKPATAPAPAPIDSTTTDKVGSYKFTVKEEGKCTLTVLYEKVPVSLEVFSYKEATRYDLILEKKDGKLTIRRK